MLGSLIHDFLVDQARQKESWELGIGVNELIEIEYIQRLQVVGRVVHSKERFFFRVYIYFS